MLTDLHSLRHRSNEIAHRANEDKVNKSGFLAVIILAVLSHSSNAAEPGSSYLGPMAATGSAFELTSCQMLSETGSY